MKRRAALATTILVLAAGCAVTVPTRSREELIKQVTEAETAFAKTMVDRDHAGFMRFIADDAVFLNGGKPLRGKEAIGEYWRRFYSGAVAPFSWKPDLVEVLGNGRLAQSVGPVSAPNGKTTSRFYSTWRLEPDGTWRVVLDDGYDVCECAAK